MKACPAMIVCAVAFRSQAAHRSEPVFELTMVCLDRIVGMPFNVMPRRWDQLLEDGRVDRGGVCHDLAGRHLQHLQRSLEEPAGRSRVAARGDEHVDDLPVLVDGAVHVPPDTIDLHRRLIHEPPVTRGVTSKPGGVCEQGRKPLHPTEQRDVVDLNAAFEEELFDVAIGQAIPQVPLHRNHDHVGREPEPGKRRRRRRPPARTSPRRHSSS